MLHWRTITLILLLCWTQSVFAGETPPKKEKPPTINPETMTFQQRVLFKTVPLKKIDSNVGLEKLTGLPTGKGNAADHYAKLESLYLKDRLPNSTRVKAYGEGVKEIIKAVTIQNCSLTPDYYPYMSKGTTKQPDIIVFAAYTQALIDLAKQLEEQGDMKGAEAVYRTGLIFGWHLTQEPNSFITYMIGVQTKISITSEYSKFLQRKLDMKLSIDASDYLTHLLRVRKAILRKTQLFLNETLAFSSLYSSAQIALADEEVFWRQEAILRLAVYRYGAPSLEDNVIQKDKALQQFASAVLTYIARNDPKPWIRELAIWSIDNVNPENFKTMRRMSNVYEQEEIPKKPKTVTTP